MKPFMIFKLKKLWLLLAVIAAVLLVIWFNQPSGFSSWRYQFKYIQIPSVQKSTLEKLSSRLKLGWKKFENANISFSYPPDWEVRGGETSDLVVVDPKSCYQTYSHQPFICERELNFSRGLFRNMNNSIEREILKSVQAK